MIRFLSSLPEDEKCSSMHRFRKSSRAASATGGSEAGVKILPSKESRAELSEGEEALTEVNETSELETASYRHFLGMLF
jgi:hypothetical protein